MPRVPLRALEAFESGETGYRAMKPCVCLLRAVGIVLPFVS